VNQIAVALPDLAATLPALVKRACSTLANATTAAEVLEAQAQANFAYDAAEAAARFAEAKGAFDEVMGAVYHSQADALEIEAAAKRRFANEYDAAQERGDRVPRRESACWRRKHPHIADSGRVAI
jgi:hypothetical protein